MTTMLKPPIDKDGNPIKPYTMAELTKLYGKSGASVVWIMRQQDWKPVK